MLTPSDLRLSHSSLVYKPIQEISIFLHCVDLAGNRVENSLGL